MPRAVSHRVTELTQTFFWKETKGLFRPRYAKPVRRARAAAAARGTPWRDVRAGQPAFRSDRLLDASDEKNLARELGYHEEIPADRHNARRRVFHNGSKDPPYISYDQAGHGAADRTGQLPPNIPWKGAAAPRQFGPGQRMGTYVPTYDEQGNVFMRRARD